MVWQYFFADSTLKAVWLLCTMCSYLLYYRCVYFNVKLLKTLRSDERCVFDKVVNLNLFCMFHFFFFFLFVFFNSRLFNATGFLFCFVCLFWQCCWQDLMWLVFFSYLTKDLLISPILWVELIVICLAERYYAVWAN